MTQLGCRVFVVDDREVPRAAARSMLSTASDMTHVGDARSGREALEAIPRIQPDVVLLDVDMAEMDGAETATRLLELQPSLKILAWTVSDTSEDLLRMIQAGCVGYVLKDVGPRELVHAVRAALRNEAPVPRRMLPDVLRRAAHQTPVRRRELPVELTEREVQTMRLLAKGFALKQIAAELDIAPSSADTHLRNLYRKLQVNNRGEAINAALRRGLLQLSDL